MHLGDDPSIKSTIRLSEWHFQDIKKHLVFDNYIPREYSDQIKGQVYNGLSWCSFLSGDISSMESSAFRAALYTGNSDTLQFSTKVSRIARNSEEVITVNKLLGDLWGITKEGIERFFPYGSILTKVIETCRDIYLFWKQRQSSQTPWSVTKLAPGRQSLRKSPGVSPPARMWRDTGISRNSTETRNQWDSAAVGVSSGCA